MKSEFRRTLKGLRADHGNMKQSEVAKKLGINVPTYLAIEQFVDNPELISKVGDVYGVKIDVTVSDME